MACYTLYTPSHTLYAHTLSHTLLTLSHTLLSYTTHTVAYTIHTTPTLYTLRTSTLDHRHQPRPSRCTRAQGGDRWSARPLASRIVCMRCCTTQVLQSRDGHGGSGQSANGQQGMDGQTCGQFWLGGTEQRIASSHSYDKYTSPRCDHMRRPGIVSVSGIDCGMHNCGKKQRLCFPPAPSREQGS